MPTKQYAKKINGYFVKDEDARNSIESLEIRKYEVFHISTQTNAEVQEIFSLDKPKTIIFDNDYTFDQTMRLNKDTQILLNSKTITFNVPSVVDDWQNCHGFFNFESTDEFTGYDGNGNISITGGKIIGGNLSFCHAKNIRVIGVDFEDCKNNHILEMCAIANLAVEDCTFAGIPEGSTGEYVQNDTASYAAFPWFNNESPTYDGTVCRSLAFRNCIFKESESEGYIFSAALGTHSGQAGETYTTRNISIENCKFVNPTDYSIQFYNVDGLKIDSCEFNGVATGESSIHIRLRSGVVNTIIRNSQFNGMLRAIEMAREHLDTKNVAIESCLFENYKSEDYSSYSIITLWNAIYVNINSNTFRDFTQRAITSLKDSGYDSTISHIVEINNNVFSPENNRTGFIVRIEACDAYVQNNSFNLDGITTGTASSDRIIAIGSSAGSAHVAANVFPLSHIGGQDMYDKPYDSTTDTGGFKHMFGSPRLLSSPDNTSATIQPTEYLKPSNFNTIILTIGSGTNTQVIELQDFYPYKKLSARTWKFPIPTSDGVLSAASLTLNSDDSLTYSGAINLRAVRLLNKSAN